VPDGEGEAPAGGALCFGRSNSMTLPAFPTV
jgi:hypothetical protein